LTFYPNEIPAISNFSAYLLKFLMMELIFLVDC